jgi:predicted extracellular nuclease
VPSSSRRVALACAVTVLLAASTAFAQGSPDLVISQVYGAGGNSGAIYKNDFIEIFNRGAAPVALGGKSLQYASATGTGNLGGTPTQITVLPNVSLAAGQYYLVQEAGGSVGAPLAADLVAANPISMAAGAGKVALVNSSVTLGCNGGSTACSAAQLALIIDLVGYGTGSSGANFFEGAGPAPTLSATLAAFRGNAGRTDTDNNASDFTAAIPAPRNSSTSLRASGSAMPASVSAGDDTTLTVIVTPGANPTSTGIQVAGNLFSIGGSATQAFTDQGDGTFSFVATVSLSTANGSKSLPVTVSDAQGRGASTTIALTVTAPVPHLAIHDVQGVGAFSPVADVVVQTEGVVTAVKSNGFFVQAPDGEADRDPSTSEGIFVFTSSAPPAAAAVGNRVRVRGTAQDFIPGSDPQSPPVTEIAGTPTLTLTVVVLSTGNPLPAPITLTPPDLDPAGSISQLSKYEGMRVHVDVLEVVAPTGGFINETAATSTSNGIFFGVLPGTPRPFREPGIEAPTVAPPGVPQFDANPERLRIDSDGQVGATALDVATGAQVSDLTGVLDFGSRTYTLDPDPGTTPTVTGNDAAAVPVRAGAGEGEITVASFNLERFYDTANDPNTSDVVLTAAAFQRRLAKASLAIRNVLHTPDILGVEEMENLTTLQALATRIDDDAVAAGKTRPGYQAYLEEGNDIGGIDVGLLVKTSRIEAIGVEQLGKNATFVQPDGATALLNDRPPLVMKAELKPSGKELPFTVRIIVNHLRSLSGIDGDDGARIRAKRLAQAEFLALLIDGYQLAGEKVVSVGDYNAFDINDGLVDVIKTVRGGPPVPCEALLCEAEQIVHTPLVDLAPADPAQHYSYVFGGNAQVLDHIIVSQSLAVNEFTYARNDADFPESLRADATRPERISDHDVPVAYFAVPRDTVPPAVAVTGVSEGAIYLLGTAPVAGCTTTDDASGVRTPATLVVTGGDADGVGAITATCAGAEDNVGNVAADVSVHYRVVAYVFGGFEPPLGKGQAVKSGSTVPVKFQIVDWNGTLVTTTSVIAALQYAPDPGCAGTPAGGWQSAAASGGTALTFDGSSFHFNWKTMGLSAGCYAIAVRTVDTLTHAAPVVIR